MHIRLQLWLPAAPAR